MEEFKPISEHVLFPMNIKGYGNLNIRLHEDHYLPLSVSLSLSFSLSLALFSQVRFLQKNNVKQKQNKVILTHRFSLVASTTF